MTFSTSDIFKEFLKNIGVKNAADISKAYAEITQKLNQKYYDSNNEVSHRRQIGSYGRLTAIHGVSDLDMAFELPREVYDRFNAYSEQKQSNLLQEIKREIQALYPSQEGITGDGQVVGVPRDGFHVEILPTFFLTKKSNSNELDLDVYTYPDTNNGGRWRETKPKLEIAATDAVSQTTNKNYRRLCRMVRAWRNTHGMGCSGLWIDTLCFNFFNQTNDYNESSFGSYGYMVRDFFRYLVDQRESSPDQRKWAAPGSRQTVHGSWAGHRKIRKAYQVCAEAIDDENKAQENWQSVFGESFPEPIKPKLESTAFDLSFQKNSKEQYIERLYSNRVDIRNSLAIDYKVTGETKTWRLLRQSAGWKVPTQRSLEFFIENTDVLPPFKVLWKVKNEGAVAASRNCTRGEIHENSSGNGISSVRRESADFYGDHWVECYIIKNNICVARNRIKVPISI